MKYTFLQFQKDYPTDDACLHAVFLKRYPDLKGYYRIKKRKAYANSKGHQIYPLKGTIFEKSRTPLTKWFYVIYMFSQAKNGVSAAEVERHIGVTSKCAWRMGHKIRSLMKQGTEKLTGVVEADETYVGAQKKLGAWKLHKSCVIGAVERGGKVRSKIIETNGGYQIAKFIKENVETGSTLYTDYYKAYDRVKGYTRGRVMHSRNEYVNGDIHSNTIEGFWSQFKRSLRGTHASVSKHHLQSYLDAQVFRWNHRSDAFSALVARI